MGASHGQWGRYLCCICVFWGKKCPGGHDSLPESFLEPVAPDSQSVGLWEPRRPIASLLLWIPDTQFDAQILRIRHAKNSLLPKDAEIDCVIPQWPPRSNLITSGTPSPSGSMQTTFSFTGKFTYPLMLLTVTWWLAMMIWWRDMMIWYDDVMIWCDDVMIWYDGVMTWYDDVMTWYDDVVLRYDGMLVP